MSRKDQLAGLQILGSLLLDLRLATLQKLARDRQESLERLAAMAPLATPADLALVAAHRAEVTYERWAEARRREINLTLARQTAELLEARDAARHAFGRAQVLKKLQQR